MKPGKKAKMFGGDGLTDWRTIARRNSVRIGKKSMALRLDEIAKHLSSP
jgi:hypothetical protein